MPRKAKVFAIATIAVVCTISALLVGSVGIKVAIVGLGAIGCAYVAWRVPTRERVLEGLERS
jgi:uncharacterized membrane protein YbaN (DUF454 family)